ncbi:MAG: response regulator [Rhodospirillales bacterium]|nr:response regulator [Rhodospirillales bacterium]
MPADQILIVDDDPVIRTLLVGYLEKEGYAVRSVADGTAMRQEMAARRFDLVVLDLTLPGEDGLTLTRELRNTSEVAIIILTSKVDTVDRVVGLEVGADDYLGKPFEPRELLARIRSVLRRTKAARSRFPAAVSPLGFAGWVLDARGRALMDPIGRRVELTAAEFSLLYTLLTNRGRPLSRDEMLDRAEGRAWNPLDRTVDVLIRRLRAKIEEDPARPRFIQTVRGLGYVFAGEEGNATQDAR